MDGEVKTKKSYSCLNLLTQIGWLTPEEMGELPHIEV